MAKPNHDHNGHRARVKQRFLKQNNFTGFDPHNILEYLLFYTIPIRDTNEIAHRLLNHFGTLSRVFDAPYSELIKVEGIGPHTASLIKSILPLSRAYAEDKEAMGVVLDTTDRISNYLKTKYLGYDEEVVSVISIYNKGKVLSFDIINRGNTNFVVADMRKILETLISTKASAAILAHNHPGGVAIPSHADVRVSRSVSACCTGIGVKLIDHIVIFNDECVSIKESCPDEEIFRNLYD